MQPVRRDGGGLGEVLQQRDVAHVLARPQEHRGGIVSLGQHELGLTFGTLVQTADRMQIYKYVVQMVAHAYGKTATFMPKPIKSDNGTGMLSGSKSTVVMVSLHLSTGHCYCSLNPSGERGNAP